MKTSLFSWSGGRSRLLFLGVFALFLWTFLPQTRNYPYYITDFNAFVHTAEIPTHPLAGWGLDQDGRRHPLFYYFFFFETQLFGLNATGYFVVLLVFHLINSLLAARLCQVLGGTSAASILSGLLFLVTSASYQNIVILCSTTRVLCLFFFLLGTLAWIQFLKKRNLLTFLKVICFQILALLAMEDALIFPLLAFFLTRVLISSRERRGQIIFRFLPVLLVVCGLVTFFILSGFFSAPFHEHWVSRKANLLSKLVSLAEVFFRPLAVPDKGFLPPAQIPENLLRLVPAVLIASWGCLHLFRSERLRFFLRGIPRRLVLISVGWIGITVLPFLLNSLSFEHANRYVYFPFVGFSWIFGAVGACFWETAQVYFRRSGAIFCLITGVYIVGLNLQSLSYNYHRYEQYAKEHREQHYYDRVKELLREGVQR